MNVFSSRTYNKANIFFGLPAVQSLEILHTFILRQPCWWAKNAHQPNFPCNIKNRTFFNFLGSFLCFIGPTDFKFGTETSYVVVQAIIDFGELIKICIIMFVMASYENHQ